MLKLVNVSKVFKTSVEVKTALDNISFEMKEGDFVTVIGGNGSGKSTLQNIISGRLKVTSGQIFLNDEDITKFNEVKRSKYFGRVFQDPRLGTASNMEIEENLAIAVRRGRKHTLRQRITSKDREEFVKYLSEFELGLEKRMHTPCGQLSGGQRQAVTLLMATINNPPLLLLDEHTAALDPKTAKKVMEYTDHIVTSKKITTLMITHNLKDAIKYGNRLIMLKAGKIIFEAEGKEKEKLTVEDLIVKFNEQSDDELPDSMILG